MEKKEKTWKCFYCKERFTKEDNENNVYSNHLINCKGREERNRKHNEGIIDGYGREILGHFRIFTDENGKRRTEKVHPRTHTSEVRITRLKNKKLRVEYNGTGMRIQDIINDKKIKLPKKILDELKKQLVIEKLKR